MKGFINCQSHIVARPYPNGPGVSRRCLTYPYLRFGSTRLSYRPLIAHVELLLAKDISHSCHNSASIPRQKGESSSQDLPFNLPTSYHLSSTSAAVLPQNEMLCLLLTL